MAGIFPMHKNGRGGQTGCQWQLELPELISARYRSLLAQANDLDMPFLTEWFQEAVRWLIKHDEQVKQAWQALMDKSPLLKKPSHYLEETDNQNETLWFDEKEWLIQIGWTRDDIPFSVSLQLREPDEHNLEWRLESVLQDKQGEAYYNCRLNGQVVEDELPEAWHEYISDTLNRISQKSLHVCPELTANHIFNRKSIYNRIINFS